MGRYALLIGVSKYTDPNIRELRSPAHDVAQLAALLRDPDIGQYDEVRTLTTGAETDLRPLLKAISNLTKNRTRADTVLLYLSCHGISDVGSGLYFAARDTELESVDATGLPSSYVRQRLERCTAGTRVQLLDCCYSARFAAGFRDKSSRQPLSEEDAGSGYVVLTASNSYEPAWEPTEVSEGPVTSVFTGAVLDALTDRTADRDGDGWISHLDLYEYVSPVVRERTNGAQTPTYFAFDLMGTVVLAMAAGAAPAQSPPPPIQTAPTAPREPSTPDPQKAEEPAEAPPTPPNRFVFSSRDHVDSAPILDEVERGESSVDQAILEAWGQFTSFLAAAEGVAGRSTNLTGPMSVVVGRLLGSGVATIATAERAEQEVRVARSRRFSAADATRLGKRRLAHFLADLAAVTREIDAVFDLAPPVFRNLLDGIDDTTPPSVLQEQARAGFMQLGVYVDRVARAWGIPREQDSPPGIAIPMATQDAVAWLREKSEDPEVAALVHDPEWLRNRITEFDDRVGLRRSATGDAVAWLSEKSNDPDVASLVRDAVRLRKRIREINDHAALGRFLDDLAMVAGDLEEHARTVQHRRVPAKGRAGADQRPALLPGVAASAGWSLDDVLTYGFFGLVGLMALGLVATLVYGVGPTYVGLQWEGGDKYRVDHHAGYIPYRTRFIWDLPKGEDDLDTRFRPTEPGTDVSTLSGNIRLATGDDVCKDAAVDWTISGKDFEVSGTSRVRNGEAVSFELDDKKLSIGEPGDEVRITAARSDTADCTTRLEWTRPGFDA